MTERYPEQVRMVGDLRDWPLADLVLWLHRCGHSVTVRVVSGGQTGSISFVDGEIVSVSFENNEGETAMARLLGASVGAFVLMGDPQKVYVPRNFFSRTSAWLLARAMHDDEGMVREVA